MNFGFSDEMLMLRDQARQFLHESCPAGVVRAIMEGSEPFARDLWQKMADLGWTGTTIPEEYGGSGLGHLALCVLAEEIGYRLAPVPFSSSLYLASESLILAGSNAQCSKWLPRIASGVAVGTFALAEGIGRSGSRQVRARFSNGLLTGMKLPVADGASADFAIVVAQTDDGLGLCLADLKESGVFSETVPTLDPSRPHARLTFTNAPAELVGRAGEGGKLLTSIYDRAAVLFAFEQVGGAQAALDMARDYALERYAFGRPIGSFQAIKHKLADIFVAIELARSNCYFGAWALSRSAAELPIAAATARACATDAYWLAAKENIQTHGGIGFSWEADCQLHYRRAKLLALALGNSAEWKNRLIGHIEASRQAS